MLNKFFKITFLLIILAEIISFLGYYLPVFNLIGFFAILALTLCLALKDIKYGILVALAELIIGSKGYLFHLDAGGSDISIRIAVWLAVMSVWFSHLAFEIAAGRHSAGGDKINLKDIKGLEFFKSAYAPYFNILFIFIAWGLASGLINHNGYGNVFFDFNGWLFFFYVLPVFSAVKNKHDVKEIISVSAAAAIWLCLETFFLLFAFSHNFAVLEELYRWIRNTGAGEITRMQGGFSRIFFQSHIYALIGFFTALVLFVKKMREQPREKNLPIYFLLIVLFLAVNLISLSRSNWLGIISGLLIFWLFGFFVFKINWKNFFIINSMLGLALFTSILLIAAAVKFPYPAPEADISTSDLLSERAREFTNEAGVSSRWSLLPELWRGIAENPILGKGFGAAVTYESDDPRVLQANPDGRYTTYSFEWGWLDIWLKLGLFGVLSYLVLLGKILYDTFKRGVENWLNTAISVSLFAVAVVSFFSPYMNHPLGIGFIILACAMMDSFRRDKNLGQLRVSGI